MRYAPKKFPQILFIATFSLSAWGTQNFFQNQAYANETNETLSLNQTIALPKKIAEKASGEGLNQADRKAIAILALKAALFDMLRVQVEDRYHEELGIWIEQAVKSRFQAYVPSWTVQLLPAKKAEVNFVLANTLFATDFKNSSVGLKSEGEASKNSKSSKLAIPTAVLVLNEQTKETFVLPAEGLPSQPVSMSASTERSPEFLFYQGVLPSPNAIMKDVNSLQTTLSERAGLFWHASRKKLSSLNVQLSAPFAESAMRFLTSSAALAATSSEPRSVWPPALPMSASTLSGQEGLLLVFTVRGADKTSVLEKVDYLRFQATEGMTRVYWSRSMNDPTLAETPAQAIDKVGASLIRNLKAGKPQEISAAHARIVVDKKVGDRDLLSVESLLKSFSVSGEFVLVPYEVTKADIRYQTPLKSDQSSRIVERINKTVPGVLARMIPGDGGFIQLIPRTK
jgi:hypothetical protein